MVAKLIEVLSLLTYDLIISPVILVIDSFGPFTSTQARVGSVDGYVLPLPEVPPESGTETKKLIVPYLDPTPGI